MFNNADTKLLLFFHSANFSCAKMPLPAILVVSPPFAIFRLQNKAINASVFMLFLQHMSPKVKIDRINIHRIQQVFSERCEIFPYCSVEPYKARRADRAQAGVTLRSPPACILASSSGLLFLFQPDSTNHLHVGLTSH